MKLVLSGSGTLGTWDPTRECELLLAQEGTLVGQVCSLGSVCRDGEHREAVSDVGSLWGGGCSLISHLSGERLIFIQKKF